MRGNDASLRGMTAVAVMHLPMSCGIIAERIHVSESWERGTMNVQNLKILISGSPVSQ